jgi:hypothetical protein
MIELNFKSAAFVAALLVVTTFFVTRSVTDRPVIYAPDTKQVQIDSLTVAKDNVIRSKSAIIDSLESVTLGFKDELDKKNEVIAGYSSIVGDLNLAVDSLRGEAISLKEVMELQSYRVQSEEYVEGEDIGVQDSEVQNSGGPSPLSPPAEGKDIASDFANEDGTFKVPKNEVSRDTVLRSAAYFGDFLLKSSAVVTFDGSDLSLHPPDISQLRQPSIDVAVLLNERTNGVRTVVTSKDFRNLRIETFTEIQPKRKRFPWFLIGVGAGVVGWEILR